jgi:hypothetical protein
MKIKNDRTEGVYLKFRYSKNNIFRKKTKISYNLTMGRGQHIHTKYYVYRKNKTTYNMK